MSKKSKETNVPLVEKHDWQEWRPFPDPRRKGLLIAPFGAGVYELRDKMTEEKILCGESKNVAARMSSLLPETHGMGTRKNSDKRDFVCSHIREIEYRTVACREKPEAIEIERELKHTYDYRFRR
jgi:hypothetical protein